MNAEKLTGLAATIGLEVSYQTYMKYSRLGKITREQYISGMLLSSSLAVYEEVLLEEAIKDLATGLLNLGGPPGSTRDNRVLN